MHGAFAVAAGQQITITVGAGGTGGAPAAIGSRGPGGLGGRGGATSLTQDDGTQVMRADGGSRGNDFQFPAGGIAPPETALGGGGVVRPGQIGGGRNGGLAPADVLLAPGCGAGGVGAAARAGRPAQPGGSGQPGCVVISWS
ncbi:hypothetical protein KPATCC21470_8582 [Kitasatospora purpeofusca]